MCSNPFFLDSWISIFPDIYFFLFVCWRRQKWIDHPFRIPLYVPNDEEERQEAMSLQMQKDRREEEVHKKLFPDNV